MEDVRKPEGFKEEKLFVLPEYWLSELSHYELTQNLYVSDIGFFPHAEYHYRERPDGCDSHIFIYCSDGEGWIELEDKMTRIVKGQLAVIPSGVSHRYGASSQFPWSIYWFHLKGKHVLDFIRLYGLDTGPLHLPVGAYVDWAEGFERCYGLLTNKPYSLPIQVHVSQTMGQLLGSIGLIAGGSAHDRKKELDLERAIQYMNDHLEDSFKLPELAVHVGLSKQHLIYLFNMGTGFPPIAYFLRMKIQKAGQLLSLTSLNVKQVAASIGISDPYYFSRLFKKIMGVSPMEYRNIPKG